MADDLAPSPTPTEAAAAVPAAPVAEAPAAPVAPAAKKALTMDEARAILRDGDVLPARREVDPLIEQESDPLLRDLEEEEAASGEAEVVTETPAAAETPAPGEVVAEVPPPEIPPADSEEERKEGRKRLNINRKGEDGAYVYNDRERAILQLSGDEGISLKDAEVRLFGQPSADSTAAPAVGADGKPIPDATTAPAAKAETAAEIKAKVSGLKAERKAALSNFENDKAAELSDQIDDLNLEALRAELREQRVQDDAKATAVTAAQTFEQQQEAQVTRAAQLYPDVATAGTPLHTALKTKVNALSAANSPIFQLPNWPVLLAAEAAAELGLAPVAATRTATEAATPAAVAKGATNPAPARAAAPAAPAKRAVPLPSTGGVSGGGPSAVESLSAEIKAARARNDLPALTKLMRQADQLTKAA